MISIYSLIWTFINCGLMTLVILFLRTRKNFLADYGTFALVVLFFCCIVRMFVPIEFPEHQFIIHNTFIYNHLLYPFFTIEFPEWIMYPIFGIWVFGSIIVFIRLFRKASHTERGIITSSQKATPMALEVLRELEPQGKVELRMSSNIIVAILTGYLHPVIFLPDQEYTREELRYILLHEYTHYKRKDIWKKLFFNILYVIFWWNPFIYVLRQEAAELIEFHCDQQLAKDLTEWEVLDYLQILRDNVERIQTSSADDDSLTTIGFTYKTKNGPTRQRFRLLLNRTASTRTKLLPKVAIVAFAAIWMAFSYYFILQTKYTIPSDDVWQDDTVAMATDDNAYLEEQEDGSYLFYYGGTSIPATKEEVDSGLYDFYPIIEYKDDTNFFSKILSWIMNK